MAANFKIRPKGIMCEVLEWIHVAWDQQRAVANILLK